MKSYKFFFTTHKWTGIIAAAIFSCTAVTGFLLLVKKDFDWIQPATQQGATGAAGDFISTQRLFEVVFARNHPDFQSLDDVDRVDFRPGKRVFKVRSHHHNAEIQVDAVSGDVLSVDVRRSDLIETIHDGSFFGDWVHDWLMPIVSASLLFMVISGLWLWIEPKIRRKRRRGRLRRKAQSTRHKADM